MAKCQRMIFIIIPSVIFFKPMYIIMVYILIIHKIVNILLLMNTIETEHFLNFFLIYIDVVLL